MRFVISHRFLMSGCLAGALLMAAGCGGSATETASEATSNAVAEKIATAALSETHKDVKVNLSESGINVSGTAEDGTKMSMVTGEGAALPADFPKDAPVPSDLTVTMATTAGDGMSVQGTSKQSLEALTSFYREKAVAQGWTEAMNFGQPGVMQTLQYTKGDIALNVMMTKDDAGSVVTLTVAKN